MKNRLRLRGLTIKQLIREGRRFRIKAQTGPLGSTYKLIDAVVILMRSLSEWVR